MNDEQWERLAPLLEPKRRPDLPSPIPTMGARRQAGKAVARAGHRIESARPTSAAGRIHRCLLHGGEKRGLSVGPTKRGKGTKIVAIVNDHSDPLAVRIQSASPHESQLVEEVLGQSFLDQLPQRLIGDAAYDSDPLDDYLLQSCGIELIAPHRSNRKHFTPGWPTTSTLPPPLARGAALRLATLVPAARHPLGIPR